VSRQEDTQRNQNTHSGNVNTTVSQDQSYIDKVTKLVQKLQSANAIERKQAKKDISELAENSAESRERIIQELVKIIEGSNIRQKLESEANFEAWEFATELLGEFKATEALDALIACIGCNDGNGGLSFDRFPALKAVITIGPKAIPKLRKALSDGSLTTRRYTALALGEIGGDDAKKALEDALLSEHDEAVLRSIRIALRQH
jgi:HEAT repeat protein